MEPDASDSNRESKIEMVEDEAETQTETSDATISDHNDEPTTAQLNTIRLRVKQDKLAYEYLTAEGCPPCGWPITDWTRNGNADRVLTLDERIWNHASRWPSPLTQQRCTWGYFRQEQQLIRSEVGEENMGGIEGLVDTLLISQGIQGGVELEFDISEQTQLQNWLEFEADFMKQVRFKERVFRHAVVYDEQARLKKAATYRFKKKLHRDEYLRQHYWCPSRELADAERAWHAAERQAEWIKMKRLEMMAITCSPGSTNSDLAAAVPDAKADENGILRNTISLASAKKQPERIHANGILKPTRPVTQQNVQFIPGTMFFDAPTPGFFRVKKRNKALSNMVSRNKKIVLAQSAKQKERDKRKRDATPKRSTSCRNSASVPTTITALADYVEQETLPAQSVHPRLPGGVLLKPANIQLEQPRVPKVTWDSSAVDIELSKTKLTPHEIRAILKGTDPEISKAWRLRNLTNKSVEMEQSPSIVHKAWRDGDEANRSDDEKTLTSWPTKPKARAPLPPLDAKPDAEVPSSPAALAAAIAYAKAAVAAAAAQAASTPRTGRRQGRAPDSERGGATTTRHLVPFARPRLEPDAVITRTRSGRIIRRPVRFALG